jgi:RsiW-degrading membrane proteinase PrsW (M82 family)
MDQKPPSPAALERTATAWRQYKRLMIFMAAAAVAAVLVALIYLRHANGAVPIHMLIATIAGVGFSVLLGTGLMGLVYFSNNSGHDEGAHDVASQKADSDNDD